MQIIPSNATPYSSTNPVISTIGSGTGPLNLFPLNSPNHRDVYAQENMKFKHMDES